MEHYNQTDLVFQDKQVRNGRIGKKPSKTVQETKNVLTQKGADEPKIFTNQKALDQFIKL